MIFVDSHQLEISLATLSRKLSKNKIDEIVKTLIVEEKKLPEYNHLLIIDAGGVAGIRHLKACIHYSIQSFKQNANLAKSLNTEILLYLSGYRQISKAIKKIGLSVSSNEIITIHIKQSESAIIDSSKFNSFFNFEEFLNERKITLASFRSDIDNFTVIDEKKLIENLEITEEEINLYLQDNPEDREAIIEKIAIEKSALLNLLK